MAEVTHYGDSSLYGDADAFYGLISSELSLIQESFFRETGLKVSVIDERVNRWEYFAGIALFPTAAIKAANNEQVEQAYWSYRGAADMCLLDNGNIVRVRNNPVNQHIEVQVITDAEDTADWESWTTYNSDVNYAVAVAPDGPSTYVIYHAKADGVYRNNSLEWAQTDVVRLRCHRGADGRQTKDALWINVVRLGFLHEYIATADEETHFKQIRKFDMYFTDDITSTTPEEAAWNFAWQRHQVASIEHQGRCVRVATYPLYAPSTAINTGDCITVEAFNDDDLMDMITRDESRMGAPKLVRGLPGDFGYTNLSGSDIFKLSDGYLYLIYAEIHANDELEQTTNLSSPLVWQRSKDGIHWTEPVHLTFNTGGIAGMVEVGDWVYLGGNGRVYRRPNTPVVYAIENYVPEVSWDSPRANETGTGNVIVANPDGVNDFLTELNDRRIIIEPGLKVGDTYEYAQLEDFWLTEIKRSAVGLSSRLNLGFSTIWGRLENQLRDVYNYPGRTDYEDFSKYNEDAPNEPFNWYFEGGQPEVINGYKLQVVGGGRILWTGWKGYNPYFSATIGNGTDVVIMYLRFIDKENYLAIVWTPGSTCRVTEVYKNVSTNIYNFGSFSGSRIGARVTWREVILYIDNVQVGTMGKDDYPDPQVLGPGYVGFSMGATYNMHTFRFVDYEYDFHSTELIRTALAIGDYHDVIIGGAGTKQYALAWGPQTDLPTAADALRQLLEAEKLELIWRDGFIEVGKFTDIAPIKVITDRIIQTVEVGEANKRINLASVDGNDSTWMEIDAADVLARDRMIQAYYDLPELFEADAVQARAIEEIRRGKLGQSPGGTVPLYFDLRRMDPVTWVDSLGNAKDVRIEGIRVSINQSTEPSQREELDTSLI